MAKRFMNKKGLCAAALAALGFLGCDRSSAPVQPSASTSSPVPAPWTPTFGKGPVEIRLYTDYFCAPCYMEEKEALSLIADLVEKNAIRITFVDFPGHKDSALFTLYFLAALNAKGGGNIRQVVDLRAALFEASFVAKIADNVALERFLFQKGFPFLPLNPKPTFGVFEHWIVEDKVLETPSCTIIRGQDKQTLSGKSKIIQALKEIPLGK